MDLRRWFGGAMTFVAPEVMEDEWERYEEPAPWDESEWRRMIGTVQVKPLEWTAALPAKDGWYYVRKAGGREYTAMHIRATDDFWPGLEFAGPLPEPRP